MDWTIDGRAVTPDDLVGHVGFVYIITNMLDGRKYVGKKLFTFKRKKKVKGRNRRVEIDSDWKTYYGSNDELKADVVRHGEEHFKREIIRLCVSKSEMSYHEARIQFVEDVLLKEDWYNRWISAKIRKSNALLGNQSV